MRKFKIKYDNGGNFIEDEFEADKIKVCTKTDCLLLSQNINGDDQVTHIFKNFYSCKEV